MNKYVIELRPDCKVVQEICESDGKVSIGAKSVNYLEELNSDYINEHFGDLQDTAYKKGLHDGESKCRYCNEYQRGFEDGKAVNDRGCEGCKYEGREFNKLPCMVCSNSRKNCWTANDKYSDIIRNGIHNWVTELNVKLDDIASILEDMRND